MSDRRGFTKVELLVVVIVIGLFVFAVLDSHDGSRYQAKKAQCAANLKGMGATLNIYAAQFKEWLPDGGDAAGVTWMCDQTMTFRDVMTGGPPKGPLSIFSPAVKVFYCPSNFGEVSMDRWTHGTVSVWGYAMLNDRGATATGLSALPVRVSPPLKYIAKLTDISFPADTELALDNIVSDGPGGAGTHFTGVKGGALPEMSYSTNHADKDRALGANVLCGDGHVSYRAFPADVSRAVAVKQGGGTEAYFWVPNP